MMKIPLWLKRLFRKPSKPRFHSGGIVNWKPDDEVPAILRQGDERWLRPGERWVHYDPDSPVEVIWVSAVDVEMCKLIRHELDRIIGISDAITPAPHEPPTHSDA